MRSVLRRTTGTSPFHPRGWSPYRMSTPRPVQPQHLERQPHDLPNCHVVTGGDVEGCENGASVPESSTVRNASDHIADQDVGLRLAAVAQHGQLSGVASQPAHEVEADAVGLAPPDDVAVAERASLHLEHVGVGADQSLAGELARAVRRDRDQRSVILGGLDLAQVAVDAAARGIGDPASRRFASSPQRRGE